MQTDFYEILARTVKEYGSYFGNGLEQDRALREALLKEVISNEKQSPNA